MTDRIAEIRAKRRDLRRRQAFSRCEIDALLSALDAANAEIERLRAADDPSLDATDGAHPAWWRGHDARSIELGTERIKAELAVANAEIARLRAEHESTCGFPGYSRNACKECAACRRYDYGRSVADRDHHAISAMMNAATEPARALGVKWTGQFIDATREIVAALAAEREAHEATRAERDRLVGDNVIFRAAIPSETVLDSIRKALTFSARHDHHGARFVSLWLARIEEAGKLGDGIDWKDRAESADAILRDVAHALGVCFCHDHGCAPGDRESLLARVAALTSAEGDRDTWKDRAESLKAERAAARVELRADHEASRVVIAGMRATIARLEATHTAIVEAIAVEDDMPAKTWHAMWSGLRMKLDETRKERDGLVALATRLGASEGQIARVVQDRIEVRRIQDEIGSLEARDTIEELKAGLERSHATIAKLRAERDARPEISVEAAVHLRRIVWELRGCECCRCEDTRAALRAHADKAKETP